jgi:D-3-phosphoglycerate dehydrogenase
MRYHIQVFNNIHQEGLRRLTENGYQVGPEITTPNAIILRSHSLHDYSFGPEVMAIGRAGAGVNNIPVDKCTEAGIVVFNTPGANANAVKELVIAGLLLASRDIFGGISWVQSLKDQGDAIPKLVEKGKSNFAGPEIQGKTLGVIGLGAIGMQVANAAESLGMRVTGFDPYISVDTAWQLSKYVRKAPSLDALLRQSDYITLHMPLNDSTRDFMDKSKIGLMKDGACLLNFARAGLVNLKDVMEAIDQDKIGRYVTDFPSLEQIDHSKIITFPHLGASTPESEKNCAIMAASQLIDFLDNGNIRNSVNFPIADLPRTDGPRLVVINRNIPAMVGQITGLLAELQINISDLLNQHRGDIAYNIIDLDNKIQESQVQKLRDIEGVIRVRYLNGD